jgi:phage terminase large subunit-like protein
VPFSQQHADAACNFFEFILKHTADEYYGKPFVLCPWQEEILCQLFGNLDDEGNRVIETVYLEVPKKSGKTEFAAGVLLFVFVTTTTPGAQVYGAGAATRQAMNVYRAACKMVEQAPVLKSRLRILRGTNRIVKREDPDSFYAAVAADGDLGDGVNPLFTVMDEVHRLKTRKQLENWDVLANGGITRKQTTMLAITTAGVQSESPLAWRLHEKTRKIQDGVVSDVKFFGRIYGAEKDDDASDPKTWIKANPSLVENGGFLPLSKIQEKHDSAVAEGTLVAFKRYFLDIWDQKENRAIDMVKWDACPMDWRASPLLVRQPEDKVRPISRELLKRFIDRRCWAGVDLSMTTDLTAAAFVFLSDSRILPPVPATRPRAPSVPASPDPAVKADVGARAASDYEVLVFFWMPEDAVAKRQLRDGMPYARWVEEGWIETCKGGVVDYRDIEARLKWADEMFDVEAFCFDPWNSRQLSAPMGDDGYQVVEVRQGFQSLNEPSKKLLNIVTQGQLHHGAHPILRFNASCVSAAYKNDNVMFTKPDREKSSSRIDGISAMGNAMSRAILFEGKPQYRKSIFDNGPVVL